MSIEPAPEHGVSLSFRDGVEHVLSEDFVHVLYEGLASPDGVIVDTTKEGQPGAISLRWTTDDESEVAGFYVHESESDAASDAVICMDFSSGERILVGGDYLAHMRGILHAALEAFRWARSATVA
ncbi:MAG: hypothetical protein AAB632_03550 [Patescibacteria group bacterium]